MSIEKKSLISTLKTTKKANVASTPGNPAVSKQMSKVISTRRSKVISTRRAKRMPA